MNIYYEVIVLIDVLLLSLDVDSVRNCKARVYLLSLLISCLMGEWSYCLKLLKFLRVNTCLFFYPYGFEFIQPIFLSINFGRTLQNRHMEL